jgi:hypothetical protein
MKQRWDRRFRPIPHTFLGGAANRGRSRLSRRLDRLEKYAVLGASPRPSGVGACACPPGVSIQFNGAKRNLVAGETACDRVRGAIVDQNLHDPNAGGFARLPTAKCRTGLTSSGVTSKTSVISSADIPASRFSNTVCTGIRVPRKTHAPLTFPGMLSTAAYCDQSRVAVAIVHFCFQGTPKQDRKPVSTLPPSPAS